MASPKRTLDSVYPNHDNITCIPLIDGKDFMECCYELFTRAQRTIYISYWLLHPYIHLLRDPEKGVDFSSRLDLVLHRIASRGIRIYIINYRNYFNGSHVTKHHLRSLHRNIRMISTPHFMSFSPWSHHQKFVVVDDCVAVCGGLDLAFGRWDTARHECVDPDEKVWVGGDYEHGAIGKASVLRPFSDPVERQKYSRMPWHDTAVLVDGQAALDIARNFVQLWNFRRPRHRIPDPVLPNSRFRMTVDPAWGYPCSCQARVVRSMPKWAGSPKVHEASVMGAYMDLIAKAEHYIYLEFQYYISNSAGHRAKNHISQVIYERLQRAIGAKETFRVILVFGLPEERGKVGEHIFEAELKSLCQGPTSLLGKLRREFPDIDITKYLGLFTLNTFSYLKGTPKAEPIFVHSKTLIVDDHTTFISSANLNDRSLLGTRDTELGVVIRDLQFGDGMMDGKVYDAGEFATQTRIRLWREHLGMLNGDGGDALRDPVADGTYLDVWWSVARKNTAVFEHVFPGRE
ncbi:Phospholipase D [Borealophlyctis nickersoniae]|nr:Phospholipase D [Borealophlyctis nickersoniae]